MLESFAGNKRSVQAVQPLPSLCLLEVHRMLCMTLKEWWARLKTPWVISHLKASARWTIVRAPWIGMQTIELHSKLSQMHMSVIALRCPESEPSMTMGSHRCVTRVSMADIANRITNGWGLWQTTGQGLKSKPVNPMRRTRKHYSRRKRESSRDATHIVGTVKLLRATRLPAQRMKLARVRVEGPLSDSEMLFEPKLQLLGERGLSIADATVSPDESRVVTLVVQNLSLQPMHPKKGEILGNIEPVMVVSSIRVEVHGSWRFLSNCFKLLDNRTQHHCPIAGVVSSQQDSPLLPQVKWDDEGGRGQCLLDVFQLDDAHLLPDEASKLRMFLLRHADLFVLNQTELGSTDIVTHTIETGDRALVRQPVQRTLFALQKQVMERVQQMLGQGIIQPSKSSWASPIVLVKKKDGSTRFCVDYRRLNAITKADVFPLPRIDDSLDLLSKAKYFTTLDQATGKWRCTKNPERKHSLWLTLVTMNFLYAIWSHYCASNIPTVAGDHPRRPSEWLCCGLPRWHIRHWRVLRGTTEQLGGVLPTTSSWVEA